MTHVPKTHPRRKSLLVRERVAAGFEAGLVAKEGLIAHGRGEAFDYLLGEKTSRSAKAAIKAAGAMLLLSKNPVISVNGNMAALCPRETVRLAKAAKSAIEVNLFYSSQKRKRVIAEALRRAGAGAVLGVRPSAQLSLPGPDSARRHVDRDGIFAADTVLVPLEDGDRTAALKKAGKRVITFDLNPLSRTAQTADITIVDNVVRGMGLLIESCRALKKTRSYALCGTVSRFDNKKNLAEGIAGIKGHLSGRMRLA